MKVLLTVIVIAVVPSPGLAWNAQWFHTESLEYDTTATATPSNSMAGPNATFGLPLGASASAASSTPSCSSGNLLLTADTGNGAISGMPDGAGGAIIVWSATTADIFAKHVLACGALDPSWPAEGVRIAGQAVGGNVITDGSGGAFVVYWTTAANSDIYAQHLLGTGTIDPSWPVNGIGVCTAAGAQSFVRATSDGAHGIFVTWNDTRVAGIQRRVFVQHVLTTGVDPTWTVNGVPATPTLAVDTNFGIYDQFLPEICSDGAGGAIVAWGDRRTAFFTNRDIFAQRFSASGALLWSTDGVPVCAAPGQQIMSGIVGPNGVGFGYSASDAGSSDAVVPDGANGCFVVWADGRTYGSTLTDVYAQHLTSTGAVAAGWASNGVAVSTGPGEDWGPNIISDGVGGALATWVDPGPVLVQHISPSGVVDGPSGGAVLSTTTVDLGQVCVPDGSGGAIFTWDENDGSGPQDSNVYAQHVRLTPPLTVDPAWPANGAPISTAPYGQLAAGLVSNGAGGAIMYWNDYRTQNWDVGTQEVLASGQLPTFSLSGHVTSSCGSGLDGVAVDAYLVGSGDLVGTGVTNASGTYTIPDLCWGGSYTTTVVTPLDYAATAQDLPANSCASSPDFGLTCLTATGTPNSMGYWKHQVGVATGGNGHADVSATTLCSYLDLIAVHFNDNMINPVVVYQPPASGICADKLQVARVLLDLQGNAATIARARQQLMSLLLNVAAGDISQTRVISSDGATVSQAITYCDNLIDSPTGNYEKAKTIADDINNGMTVPAGMIPLSTAQIAYRKGMERVSFRVTANTGSAAREFQFMTGARGPVSLRLYDVSGRLVAQLYRGNMEAGPHSVIWNGRTSSGVAIARGLYFARLQTPRESPTIKVVELTASH